MKKSIYLLLVILFTVACSSEPGYVVKGEIEGSDSIEFMLQIRRDGKTVIIDSAVSKKGSFTMKGGKIDYPQLVQLVAGETRKRVPFYLENSRINIEGTLDSLFDATITGSKTHDEYDSFVDSNTPLTDEYTKLISDYQTAKQASDTAKIAGIEKRAGEIENEMIENQKNFVRNNPSSYVSPSILSGVVNEMEASEIESIISKFDTAIANMPQVKAISERAKAMKAVEVGQKAPDFTMNDVEGNPVTLASKVGSKLLLIDFWAAWCQPCRLENPNVVKVYQEFNKKGFDVFGISLDQSKDEWVKAIADDNLTWTHVSDLQSGNAVAKLYAVSAIPANFLLDETGTIIGRNLRGEDLYNKVNEILRTK